MVARILCLRFPNWPVQVAARRLRNRGEAAAPLALRTRAEWTDAGVGTVGGGRGGATGNVAGLTGVLLEDWRLVRELFPAARTGPAVVAVDRGAWERGVRPGLPLAEARSLAQVRPVRGGKRQARVKPAAAGSAAAGHQVDATAGAGAGATQLSVQFVEWNPEEDRRELELLGEVARRFAPVVALDELPLPDSLLLDITGCEHLFGGERELAEELLREISDAGLQAVVGVGGRVSAAWAIAHWDPSESEWRAVAGGASGLESGVHPRVLSGSYRVRCLPVGSDRPGIDRLPITAARLPQADVSVLRDLGVGDVGRLLRLPVQDLPSRLSAEAVQRVQQLSGVLPEYLVNLPERDPIVADWSEEQPAQGLRDLMWVLSRLSAVVAGELVRRRQMCGGVECEFRLGSGENLQFAAGLVRPTQDAELLSEVSSLRLEYLLADEQRRGVSGAAGGEVVPEGYLRLAVEPVVLVRFRALAAQLPPARQRSLFGESLTAEEPVEHLAALVSRLTGRLGGERVLRVSERADVRPEFSLRCEPVPDAMQAGGAGAAERALERLAGLAEPLDRLKTPVRRGARGVADQQSSGSVIAGRVGAGIPDATSVVPRPLRLLEVPVDVTAELLLEGVEPLPGQSFVAAEQQLRRYPQVRAEGQVWEVEGWSAAERLQTGWWTDRPCQRDYYVVLVRGGSRLWLYRDLQTGRWYLHGVFD